MKAMILGAVMLAVIATASACRTKSAEPVVLGGVEVSASILESGTRVYRRSCAPCHGVDGDGRGPSGRASWPPPRDFTRAKFKFAGVIDRGLPADEELARIIRNGLPGSAMPAWDLPEGELADVIDTIKAFSAPGRGFRDPTLVVTRPVIGPDPYASPEARAAAVAEGEALYHQIFECAKCHPSYIDASRPTPSAKWSDTYQSVLLPTDFRRHPMRSVRRDADGNHRVEDLYRVIAYGLHGPMPGYLHLGSAKVWAVAHYVKSLSDAASAATTRALR